MCPQEPCRSEDSPRKPRSAAWKRLAKRLALTAATLLLLLLCCEIATRLLTDTVPPLTQRDPVLGQRHLRSFEADVYDPEARRKVRLRFNREGFRGPDRPYAKPPGVRRVAVLGDSMIAAIGVAEEQTLVCQLQGMLNRSNPEAAWEVLNFGVAGSSPGQEMVLYKEVVSRYDPDVVLCAFFVENDLADNSSRLSNSPRIYFDLDEAGGLRQLPFSAGRAESSRWLNRYSRFYVWQKGAFRRARHRVLKKVGGMRPGEWIYCTRESDDLKHAWKLSGELARAFDREVTGRGALFALVMLPSSRQVYHDAFQRLLDRVGESGDGFDPDFPDRRLGDLCRRAGVPFCSLTADFRAAAPGASMEVEEEWLFFNGMGHFNERGNRFAAEAIHRFLTGRGTDQVAGRPLLSRLR